MKRFAYALSAFAAVAVAPVAPAYAQTATTITGGQNLMPGQSWTSPDGRFTLSFQTDGNFVLYQGTKAIWDINKTIQMPSPWTPWRAGFQLDGNLVVYWKSGGYASPETAIWDTNTQGNSGSVLKIQNDGNVVIYNSAGKAIWDTNTCCR